MKTRTWARTISGNHPNTTYVYDEDTGVLTDVEYRVGASADADTPKVSFTRDRLGRITTVTDAAGVRTMTYDADTLQLVSEAIAGTGGLINRTITRDYSPANDPVVRRRPIGLHVGTDEYVTKWYYDEYSRLNRVQGPGLPAYGAVYGYQANSDLVAVTGFLSDESTTRGTATRTFEDHRDVVTEVANSWGSTPTLVSKYHYASDALSRRTSVVNTGTVFNPNRFTLWTYDDRNELTASRRYNGIVINNTTSPVTTQQFIFDFDPIGNRQSYRGDGVEGAMSYTTNDLNQYTTTSQPTEEFTYDADGNLTATGKHAYTYDGENRLIVVVPIGGLPSPSDRKVTFTYDYLGRRVRKQAFPRSGNGWSTTPTLDRRFVYDGWNLLEELNGLASNAVLFKYTWGLDLSGQNGSSSVSGLHGAGGVGGLLAMTDTKGTSSTSDDRKLAYFYDANGNVGQLIDCDPASAYFGQIQARYEYYPFGGILVSTGTYAEINPFKFSTKYRDSETGLYYWDYRYLIPRLGRWVNRDPIGELGGLNLYEAVRNNPVNQIDPDGLCSILLGCTGGDPPASNPTSGTTTQPTSRPGCESTTKPSKPRKFTDAEKKRLCDRAKELNLDKGDGGGVICVDGQAIACNWTKPTGNTGADNIIDECVRKAHEPQHIPQTDCSGPNAGTADQPTRPEYRDEETLLQDEVEAYRKEKKCYDEAFTSNVCETMYKNEPDRKKAEDLISECKKEIARTTGQTRYLIGEYENQLKALRLWKRLEEERRRKGMIID